MHQTPHIHNFLRLSILEVFKYTISNVKGGTDEATVVVSVAVQPTMRPSARPTKRPPEQVVTPCKDHCFQVLDPGECPMSVILPPCSNTTLGSLCKSDGECELAE